MTMKHTPLSLSRQALMKIGADPITTLKDSSLEAQLADSLYPDLRDAMLCEHPWSFASKTIELEEHRVIRRIFYFRNPPKEETPKGRHRFPLPKDFLRALSASPLEDAGHIPYHIVGRFLDIDSPRVFLEYIRRVDEAEFPPFFHRALVERLAAEFCLPLTENSARSEWLGKRAHQTLQRAKLIDSQQDSTSRIEDFTLIDVRG